MRNYALVITVGLGLAAAASLAGLEVYFANRGSSPPSAVVALPPPPAPVPASMPPPPQAALPAPPTAPEASSGSAAPPAAALPSLPSVVVPSQPVHSVPDDEPPMPTVTLFDRKGRMIKEFKPSPPVAAAPAPAASSMPGQSAALARPPNMRLAPKAAAVSFKGAAQVTGPTMLAVDGHEVRLFGVKGADGSDRCGLGASDDRSCTDVAREALAQRLRRYPSVVCHVPPGQSGSPAAICTDASGTDLGGFLVAEGYALADTAQSYEYYGAQGVARSFRRGLWRYR